MTAQNGVTISCLTLGAALLAAGCGGGEAETAEQAGADRSVTVRVEPLVPTGFSEIIQLTGVVKASEDVLISPEEGGTVKRWNALRGSWVEAGSVIVELSDDVLRPGYEAALAQYNTAELNFRKQEKVFAEQAVSELQLRSSQYARDAAKAQADLAKARYERSRITTPVSGLLDERFVDAGEMASPGQPIARVVNTGSLKVLVNVPERFAGRIRSGTPLTFTVSAYGSELFTGRVSFVGTAISPDNRTFQIEALLGNRGGRLKPEMIARVNLVQSTKEKALVLPEEILQRVDRDRVVVYVEEGGVARERVITTGGRAQNRVEVLSGLKAGDRLIVSGFRSLTDGQAVTVAE